MSWSSSLDELSSVEVAQFHSAWATFLGTFLTSIGSGVFYSETRFYERPVTAGPLGDPVFTDPWGSSAGGAGGGATLPPQVAATVTLQTEARRHWGRIYLGGWVASASADGRITSAICDAVGAGMKNYLVTMEGHGFTPEIWNRTAWSGLPVLEVSMDNVWDVQRRRRYDQQTHRYDSGLI